MASPAPGEQPPSVLVGQKRKREEEEIDAKPVIKNEVKNEIEHEKADTKDEDVEGDGGARIDTNTLVPDDYEHEEASDVEGDDSDEDNENAVEDDTNYPKHDESDEPFPACAYYDEAIDDVDEKLTSIAERVYDLLEEHDSSSPTFADPPCFLSSHNIPLLLTTNYQRHLQNPQHLRHHSYNHSLPCNGVACAWRADSIFTGRTEAQARGRGERCETRYQERSQERGRE